MFSNGIFPKHSTTKNDSLFVWLVQMSFLFGLYTINLGGLPIIPWINLQRKLLKCSLKILRVKPKQQKKFLGRLSILTFFIHPSSSTLLHPPFPLLSLLNPPPVVSPCAAALLLHPRTHRMKRMGSQHHPKSRASWHGSVPRSTSWIRCASNVLKGCLEEICVTGTRELLVLCFLEPLESMSCSIYCTYYVH